MATDIRLKEALPEITDAVVATYTECSRTSHLGHKPLPSRESVADILTDLMDVLFPGYWRRQNLHIGNVVYHVGDLIDRLHDKLIIQIARALRRSGLDGADDDVPDARVAAVVAAHHADAQELTGTRVVGDAKAALLLDH